MSKPPAPPPKGESQSFPIPEYADLSADDRDFIEKVFAGVADVDFLRPPPRPPKPAAGVEKKLEALRETIRRLERDLARLAHIWKIKEGQFEGLDQIIQAERNRREQSDRRYEKMKQEARRVAQEFQAEREALAREKAEMDAHHREQIAAADHRFTMAQESHEAQRAEYEETLQKRHHELVELRQDFEASVNQWTDKYEGYVAQTTDTIAHLEARIETLEDEGAGYRATIDTRDGELEELRRTSAQQIESLESALEDMRSLAETRAKEIEDLRLVQERLQEELKEAGRLRNRERTSWEERLEEKERSVFELTNELSATREEFADTRRRLESEIDGLKETHKETLAQIRADLTAERDNRRQVETQLETVRVDFERDRHGYVTERDELIEKVHRAESERDRMAQEMKALRMESRANHERLQAELDTTIANLHQVEREREELDRKLNPPMVSDPNADPESLEEEVTANDMPVWSSDD